MEPRQTWGAFSIVVILADAVVAALFIDLGYEPLLVLTIAMIGLLVYFYVIYKRYHVEVVPENDIVQFEDQDDLRILCDIYGLDSGGTDAELRARLVTFARVNRDKSFIWIVPRAVQFLGSALEMPSGPIQEPMPAPRSLLGEGVKPAERVHMVGDCPICGAVVQDKDKECKECGADLEFYVALGESKIGKLMLSEKAGEVRRKLRYEVPSLRDDG